MYFSILGLLCISLYYVEAEKVPYKLVQYSKTRSFPSNPLPAGSENGKILYIGMNSIAGKVIEKRNLLEIVDDHGNVQRVTENFWIVTSDHLDSFAWIPGNYTHLELPDEVKPVTFGMLGFKYIARAGPGGEQTIGTLHCDKFPLKCATLVAVNKDGKKQKYDDFEVLVYHIIE